MPGLSSHHVVAFTLFPDVRTRISSKTRAFALPAITHYFNHFESDVAQLRKLYRNSHIVLHYICNSLHFTINSSAVLVMIIIYIIDEKKKKRNKIGNMLLIILLLIMIYIILLIILIIEICSLSIAALVAK